MSDAFDVTPADEVFDIEREAERSGTGVVVDPYPLWAAALAKGPVHKGPITDSLGLTAGLGSLYRPGFDYYSAFSFAAASDAFTRKDDFGSEFYHDLGTPQSLGDSILNMDGLRHRRYRTLIQEHFQPAAASSWWREKIVGGLVDELVDQFESSSQVDLNACFFARLPMRTVTAGFGLSPEDGLEFRRCLTTALSEVASPEQKLAAVRGSDEVLERVILARRVEPQDDLISRLAVARLEEDDGSGRLLTVEEIVAFCRLIVFAGGGTTWKQLGVTLFALLNDRAQLEAVMADRTLVQNAILESARWYPNDPLFARKAKRDTELEGVAIPAGAVIHICLGAANRDPARWDEPEKYHALRPVKRSLAFGAGSHSCLGQHVAREEIATAFNALFDRFPDIRWDPSHPPAKLSGGIISRGPGPLHVLLR